MSTTEYERLRRFASHCDHSMRYGWNPWNFARACIRGARRAGDLAPAWYTLARHYVTERCIQEALEGES